MIHLELRCGYRVTRVGVDRFGLVDPEDVRSAIEPATALISIIHANNEVGTVQPIAAVAHERGVLVHTDAAQSTARERSA